MGSGKSSVGHRLSSLLHCPFVDLDRAIEEDAGCSISEIFETEGEDRFRERELLMLHRILEEDEPLLVLSLGGGTVCTPECAELLSEHTVCVYLRTSFEAIVSRIGDSTNRPLFRRDSASDLYAKRLHIYESTAEFTIDTDGLCPDEIASNIRWQLSV